MPRKRKNSPLIKWRKRRLYNLVYSARQIGFDIDSTQKQIFINSLEFTQWANEGINVFVKQLINDYLFTIKFVEYPVNKRSQWEKIYHGNNK
jgi:hypothetical protein